MNKKRPGPKSKGLKDRVTFRVHPMKRALLDAYALADGLPSASEWLRVLVDRTIDERSSGHGGFADPSGEIGGE